MRYLLLLAMAGRIGIIDFFGCEGVDTGAIRAALPFKQGDRVPSKKAAREAAARAAGREPSDVALVCCDEQRNWIVFLGLGGAPVRYNPAPAGSVRLPSEAVRLYESMMRASFEAVRRGAAMEDNSAGYALSKDPSLRTRQLAFRDWTLRHEAVIFDVAGSSGSAEDRAVAAEALGYSRQNEKTVAALVNASFDADGATRNNAVRALGVLVRGNPALARYVAPDRFIELLRSGTWTDRNKASFLMLSLTASREPALLEALRARAHGALVEMARWRSPGHATPARIILGRVAGIDDTRLRRMLDEPEAIVRAAQDAQR